MNADEIGHIIREYRKKKGLTQRELGDSLGISDKTISRWETGRVMPDLEMYTKVFSTLDIPPEKGIGLSMVVQSPKEKSPVNIHATSDKKFYRTVFAVIVSFCTLTGILLYGVTTGNSKINNMPSLDSSHLSVSAPIENGGNVKVELYSPDKDELYTREEEYGAGIAATNTN